MPRPKRTQPSYVASAVAYTTKRLRPVRSAGKTQDWQAEGWRLYDTVGELAFACGWVANCLSRVTLKVVRDDIDPETGHVTTTDVSSGPAVDALDNLFYGESGQGQMMAALGLHMSLPGEAYLVGFPPDDTHPTDRWEVYSTDECRETAPGIWAITDRLTGVDITYTLDRDEDPPLIIRLWRPHPRQALQATSPVRAAIPVLREIEELANHKQATIDSKLAGAGILAVAQEATWNSPTPPPTPAPGETIPEVTGPPVDPLIIDLINYMVDARENDNSPGRIAPFIVRLPANVMKESGGGLMQIKFATPFDERVQGLQDAAFKRLAVALDIPAEVLTGMGDLTHWNAWQIDEAGLKVHIAPLCELICHGLTTRWLWPVIEGRAGEDVNNGAAATTQVYRITYDDTDLRQRPDHSADAAAGHERLAISDAAYLREIGLEDDDAPQPEELRQRLLIKAALGGAGPEVAVAALKALGVSNIELPAAAPMPGTPPALGPGPVSDPETTRGLPDQRAAVLASAELMVLRATERARNKVQRRSQASNALPKSRLVEALDGAWDFAPRVAALTGVDEDRLTSACDTFTRGLLSTGAEYDPTVLARLIDRDVLSRPLRAVDGG